MEKDLLKTYCAWLLSAESPQETCERLLKIQKYLYWLDTADSAALVLKRNDLQNMATRDQTERGVVRWDVQVGLALVYREQMARALAASMSLLPPAPAPVAPLARTGS